jgi:O-antigen/teichoic acid export membrane protein
VAADQGDELVSIASDLERPATDLGGSRHSDEAGDAFGDHPRVGRPARKPRPLTEGAVRSAVSQFVSAGAGALTTLILARILGPAGTGRYAVTISLVIGLQTFATLSLQVSIGYFVGRGTWPPRQAFVTTQLAALGLGLTSVAVALLIRALFPSAFHNISVGLVLVAAAGLPCALSWTFAAAVALAVDQYELYAVPQALQTTVGIVVILVLGAIYGVGGALLGLTISHAVTAAVSFVWCRRALPASDGRATEPGQFRRAVAFALKSHVANAVTFITYRLDIFILNGVTTATEVGQYAIAVSVTQAVWLLPDALSSIVVPRLARVSWGHAAVDDDYQDLVERKSVRHATILALVSALVLSLALLVLVLVFLGSGFHESIELGLILMPGSAMLAVASALASVMVGRGRPEISMMVAFPVALLAIALYVFVIPSYGAVGAAVASSVSYAIGFVLTVVIGSRRLGCRLLPLVIPTRSELDDYRRLAPWVLRLWPIRRV